MTEADVKRNVRLYTLYQIFHEPMFWGPILISYLKWAGKMSLADIYFMEGVVSFILALFQVPMGALADLIGRKRTVVLGVFFFVAELMLFSFADSAIMIWIPNLMWMVGASLVGGADSALLYDSLRESKSLTEDDVRREYRRIYGRAIGYRYLLVAVLSLPVGYMASIWFRLPLLLSVPGLVFCFLVVLRLKEPPRREQYSAREQIRLTLHGFVYVLRHSKALWIIAFAFLVGVTLKVWFFTYNDYFDLVGVRKEDFGIPFFFLNVVAMLASRFAEPLERKLGSKGSAIFIVIFSGVPILVMGLFSSVFAISMIVASNVVRGFVSPFWSGMLNECVEDSRERATVLSVKETFGQIAACIGLISFAVWLQYLPLTSSLIGLAVVMLGGGALLVFWSYRIFR